MGQAILWGRMSEKDAHAFPSVSAQPPSSLSGSGLARCVHSSVVVQRAAEGPAEPTTALSDRQKETEREGGGRGSSRQTVWTA